MEGVSSTESPLYVLTSAALEVNLPALLLAGAGAPVCYYSSPQLDVCRECNQLPAARRSLLLK